MTKVLILVEGPTEREIVSRVLAPHFCTTRNLAPAQDPDHQVGQVWTHPRFDPHLMLHETEALIFSNPLACEMAFPDRRIREALARIGGQFESPELIDEGPTTAPSKRILDVMPDYDKVFLGPLAIEEIGLEPICSACPHFKGWLRRLEALGR